MSTKIGTYISLLGLLLLGIVYLFTASNYTSSASSTTLGPAYFPTILGIGLIIMCVISGLQTRKKKDEKIEMPNLKLIFITVGIISLYFIVWYFSGYFYISTFLFLFILFTIFKFSKENVKKLIFVNFIVSAGLLVVIYVIFSLLLSIQF